MRRGPSRICPPEPSIQWAEPAADLAFTLPTPMMAGGMAPALSAVSQEEREMKKPILIIMAALLTAAGCNKGNDRANDALQTDLNLAAQANSQRSLDSISAVERGYGAPAAASTSPATRRPASRTSSSSTARRSTSSSSAGPSGTSTAPATESRTTVQKNTKRDAAIGAAAGAVIGATTSRNKVKGAVIGAAAGGILGGIIGNNVDVKKKKQP